MFGGSNLGAKHSRAVALELSSHQGDHGGGIAEAIRRAVHRHEASALGHVVQQGLVPGAVRSRRCWRTAPRPSILLQILGIQILQPIGVRRAGCRAPPESAATGRNAAAVDGGRHRPRTRRSDPSAESPGGTTASRQNASHIRTTDRMFEICTPNLPQRNSLVKCSIASTVLTPWGRETGHTALVQGKGRQFDHLTALFRRIDERRCRRRSSWHSSRRWARGRDRRPMH